MVSGVCYDFCMHMTLCRIDNLELTLGALSGDSGNWINGKASAAELLRFQNSMHLPMLHAPGAQYCYVNTNFNIAGYVVEKVICLELNHDPHRNHSSPDNTDATLGTA